jgi:predicted peptidase
MKKPPLIYLSLLSIIILSFSNCKTDEEVPPPARTIIDVQNDFGDIDTSSGIHDETLEFLFGKFWNFRVIAPQTTDGETYPLVLHLHGASGGNPDAHKSTDCYVEPGFEAIDAFIISPNGGAEQWNHFDNQEMVVNLLVMAQNYWPIDPDKIVVTGYSNGGNGSWFFGETQPSIISAAIPMASSYTTSHTDGSVRVMPIPMYVIHGENDDLFPVAETQNWVTQSVDAGSDLTFVVAPGLGHYEPCEYVPYLQDAVTWLTDVVWQ